MADVEVECCFLGALSGRVIIRVLSFMFYLFCFCFVVLRNSDSLFFSSFILFGFNVCFVGAVDPLCSFVCLW